jgi:hypothetical protein
VSEDLSARLAGITVLDVHARFGTLPAYLFDPHRLAFVSWAHALEGKPPALLITLDRHTDLLAPHKPVPRREEGLRALDEHARWEMDARNVDHVLAAMEAGFLTDVLSLARTVVPGSVTAPTWKDRHGVVHRIHVAPTLARVCDGFGTATPSLDAEAAALLLSTDAPIVLDVDLDTFTTPSDADPMALCPWPPTLIRDFLFPQGSEAFWAAVLPRCVAVTLAREPLHCGGVTAASALFSDVAQVVFTQLLGADVP